MQAPGPEAAGQTGVAFAQMLADQLDAASCVLDAVVSRVSLPLMRVMALKVGEVITLPRAAIDRICLEGLDGRALAEGRLGQNRGMRAIRLAGVEAVPQARAAPPVREGAVPAEPLRQTG